MGLSIKTQIGTLDGLTSKAYVRIVNYNISKQGYANFTLETFMSKEDSIIGFSAESPSMIKRPTQSNQIGTDFRVSLTKEVSKVILVPGVVSREVSYTNAEGEVITETKDFNEMVEQTTTEQFPYINQLEDVSIFTFAYGKLKEKLQNEFGATKVIDA